MTIYPRILAILDQTLGLRGRALTFAAQTPLLGALAELDSLALVRLITSLEEQFGLIVADDEIDGSAFATVESLVHFVQARLPE